MGNEAGGGDSGELRGVGGMRLASERNVDLVYAERIKGDPRLPFGLPGVNKQKKVSEVTTCGSPTSGATGQSGTRKRRNKPTPTGLVG